MQSKREKAIAINRKKSKYADPKKVKDFERELSKGEHMLDHRDNLKRIGVSIVTHNRDIKKQKIIINKLAKEIGLPNAK